MARIRMQQRETGKDWSTAGSEKKKFQKLWDVIDMFIHASLIFTITRIYQVFRKRKEKFSHADIY